MKNRIAHIISKSISHNIKLLSEGYFDDMFDDTDNTEDTGILSDIQDVHTQTNDSLIKALQIPQLFDKFNDIDPDIERLFYDGSLILNKKYNFNLAKNKRPDYWTPRMDMLKHIFPDTVYQNAKYNKRSKKLSWKYTSDNLQEFIHLCTVLYVLYAQKIITMKYSYYGEDYLRKIVSNNSYNILNMNAVTKEQNIVSFKLPDDSLRIYISITPGDDKIKVKPEDGIIPYNNIGDYPEPIFDKTKIYVPNAVYNYEDYKATVTEYNVCNINFTIKIESYHKE